MGRRGKKAGWRSVQEKKIKVREDERRDSQERRQIEKLRRQERPV